MDNPSWERVAEAMLLLYFEPEELQRRTPGELRLLALLQFAEQPPPDEPTDPTDKERRMALANRVAKALAAPPITSRRRSGNLVPGRRGPRRGTGPPASFDEPPPDDGPNLAR